MAEFPVTQGSGMGMGGAIPTPQIVPVPSPPKIVYIPETKKEESKSRNAVIDPLGKNSMEVVS